MTASNMMFQHLETLPVPSVAKEQRHFVNNIDSFMTLVNIDRIKQFSFVINDIPYHVMMRKDRNGDLRVYVQAVLGYLPYSIDAEEKRQAILMILSKSFSLSKVRFGIDHHGRIFAAGNFIPDVEVSPHFIFFPLTCFLQEAQPFIDLIGNYL